jgi:predicted dehydrogenase
VTRVASGARDDTEFSVFGSKGSLHFRIDDPLFVRWHDFGRGQWTHGALELPAIQGERPIDQLWPSGKYTQGTMTDAHLASAYDFLMDVAEGKPSPLDFQAGLATQEVVGAAYRSAAEGGALVGLPLWRKFTCSAQTLGGRPLRALAAQE